MIAGYVGPGKLAPIVRTTCSSSIMVFDGSMIRETLMGHFVFVVLFASTSRSTEESLGQLYEGARASCMRRQLISNTPRV